MSGAGDLAMPLSTRPGCASPIRVCLVGPSLDILGGQAVQLQRLLRKLREVPELEVEFLPVNPRLAGRAAAAAAREISAHLATSWRTAGRCCAR